MRLINWVQFAWQLAEIPELDLPEHYEITRADADDEKEVRKVIGSSFTLDPEWNPTMHEVMQTVDGWLATAFESERHTVLVLRHGSRIIGASALSSDPTGENHLAPGPCILMEYRNRGFGARLLERSLRDLREGGLTRAFGMATENSPVTKFLYTKFGGTSVPRHTSPLIAA